MRNLTVNGGVFLQSVTQEEKIQSCSSQECKEYEVIYKIFFHLTGEGSGSINDPNREMLAKTEVSLTLTNKFDVPGDENAEMDARTILLK